MQNQSDPDSSSIRGRIALTSLVLLLIWSSWKVVTATSVGIPADRERVVFWHFWGGAERKAVQDIVRRFNASQEEFFVEEVPIPGSNLDMKFFMAVSGGDFPDLVNQDDQVIAQWAERGVLTSIRDLCSSDDEYTRLQQWLSPPAQRIGTYEGKLYALCNALDIRAIVYRKDFLSSESEPKTLADFDADAKRKSNDPSTMRFLPDDRRLWAWGIAFGGDFYNESTGKVTANHPRIIDALEWMVSYSQHHGVQQIQTFRSTNREVGAGSMLIEGRYQAMLDGQWRVPELDSAAEQIDYSVMPLPAPPDGRSKAGWVNGNFFLVPKGAKNKRGAWAFMKFWSGFDGNEREAAVSATAGGWIPASIEVTRQPVFEQYMEDHPNFRTFVELSQSPHQIPTPSVPVQAYFYERVNLATEEAINLTKTPQQALDDATWDIQSRLDAARSR